METSSSLIGDRWNGHVDKSDFAFCEKALERVSRTFALNIGTLRGHVYKGVLLAYLLCRIADTVEDDDQFPPRFKIEKLLQYSRLFPPLPDYGDRIAAFLDNIIFPQATDCAVLLKNVERVFNEFVKLPRGIIDVVSHHVKEMALGMASFQEKCIGNEEVIFLKDQADLERYCYYVAGTVGLMLTAIFSWGSKRITPSIQENLQQRSVAFGLGLQLTNIVKDFSGDRQRGWCYIPRCFFAESGIDPLKDRPIDHVEAFLSVQKRVTTIALGYLDEALYYTLAIPRTLIRYRLFCLWPLFMAVETLAKLCGNRRLLEGQVIKISRHDARRIMRNTSLAVMSNCTIARMYQAAKSRIG